MPVCSNCKTTFHSCSSCGYINNWEHYLCSIKCWRESNEYKKYCSEFKALYSTINNAQKKMFLHLLDMSNDYLGEIDKWKEEVEKKEEIRKHNMKYLKLDDQQYAMHEFYMQTPMEDWPKSLIDYIKVEHGNEPACGDALSCLIAEWIKILR